MERRAFLSAALVLTLAPRMVLANRTRAFYFGVKAEDAKEHNLPPIGFGFEYPKDKKAPPFPAKDVFVSLKDIEARTGFYLFEVLAYRGANTAKTLEDFLRQHLKGQEPFALGKPCTIELAQGNRQALGCITRDAAARTEYCAILLPAGPGKQEGALVLMGLSGGGPLNSPQLAANPQFQPMMKSFVLVN